MRVRLSFEPPLPPYKCWYKVGKQAKTIRDLQHDIYDAFQLASHCKALRLDLDGFYLVPSSPVDGLLHDNDIVSVKRRVKKDRILLPPSTSVKGSKRSRKDRDNFFSSTKDKSERKKKTPLPARKKRKAITLRSGKDKDDKDGGNSSSDESESDNESSSSESSSDSEDSSSDSDSSSSSSSAEEASSTSDNDNSGSGSSSDDGDVITTVALASHGTARKLPKESMAPTTNASLTVPQPAGLSIPFQGSSATRKRNARKKAAKIWHRQQDNEAKGEPKDGGNMPGPSSRKHSTPQQGQRQQAPPTPTTQAKAPPKAAKSTSQSLSPSLAASTIKPLDITSSFSTHHQHTPLDQREVGTKVFITTAELNDKSIRRRNQPRDHMSGQHIQQPHPRQNKNHQQHQSDIHTKAHPTKPSSSIPSSSHQIQTMPLATDKDKDSMAPVFSTANVSSTANRNNHSTSPQKVKTNGDTAMTTRSSVVDYSSLKPLESGTPLAVGTRIVYKVLEMSPSYTPIMSDFREAKVLAYDHLTRMAELELAPQHRQVVEYDDDGHPILGKFDIFDPEDLARLEAGLVQIDMSTLAECRVFDS